MEKKKNHKKIQSQEKKIEFCTEHFVVIFKENLDINNQIGSSLFSISLIFKIFLRSSHRGVVLNESD